ncbi:hypothetical protein FACS18949_08830 [Clostridia bacterium]|nr:hypothetical protein FACS18949_08830 [Clostridia bacterium]
MSVIIVRTVVMYLVVVAALRLMGKRQLGELEPSELVTAIIMSELAAMPIVDTEMPVWHAIAAVATLSLLEITLSLLTLKSHIAKRLLCARPSVLMENGEMNTAEMRRNRVTRDELMEELRIQGVIDPLTVRRAILESNGKLSVEGREPPKKPKKPKSKS